MCVAACVECPSPETAPLLARSPSLTTLTCQEGGEIEVIVASVAGRLCGCGLFACVAHALGSHDLWLMGWSPNDRPVYPLNVNPNSLPCPCLCRTACPLREESLRSCSAAPSRPIRFQSVENWWFQATHTKLGSLSAHETTPGPFRVSGCYD